MSKTLKKIISIILIILAIIFTPVIIYLIYYFTNYYRIEDNQILDIVGDNTSAISVDTPLSIVTYNIGFGAYSYDYSFFMDGGTESIAFSKDAVLSNTTGSYNLINSLSPDIILMQEVDINSTRSYHVDQYALAREAFPNTDSDIAIAFDSPYLMYPLLSPHGKSLSGLSTISNYNIKSAVRRSLPIDKGLARVTDLDRCYSRSDIEVEDGRTLCIYNVHLSAYSTEPDTITNQISMLVEDINNSYKNGNYVIIGGDFNQDLIGNSDEVFANSSNSDYSWARSFPMDKLPESFSYCNTTNTNPIRPTCRNANSEYVEGSSIIYIVDGFIISDNIEYTVLEHIYDGFLYSDHQPVYMEFKLKP